eukprot:TRINITY_DN61980_c0_g1_i1.p1 TRINITY_DN61980_c0_g1~~TRINITY_DN61980_c0_g1_i1.p1  ORF type:complete len:335 (-),score=69.40 TRINITY_DN61980_c0_g1_i1:161-1135(-)
MSGDAAGEAVDSARPAYSSSSAADATQAVASSDTSGFGAALVSDDPAGQDCAAALADAASVDGVATGGSSRSMGFLASASGKGGGQELTPIAFHPCVKDSPSPWLVEFHSAMCDTCREFQPRWAALASWLSERRPDLQLRFGRVNIDITGASAMARKEGVLRGGVPCITFFPGRGETGTVVWVTQGSASTDEDDVESFPSTQELADLVLARYVKELGDDGGVGQFYSQRPSAAQNVGTAVMSSSGAAAASGIGSIDIAVLDSSLTRVADDTELQEVVAEREQPPRRDCILVVTAVLVAMLILVWILPSARRRILALSSRPKQQV